MRDYFMTVLEVVSVMLIGSVVVGVALLPLIHFTNKQSCFEYAEKKGVVVEYKFASGCWVEKDNQWQLKSTIEKEFK